MHRSSRCRTASTISALAYYPNNLDPDRETRAQRIAHLRRVIDAARALGVGLVATFLGRDHAKPLAESLDDFRAVFPTSSATPASATSRSRSRTAR